MDTIKKWLQLPIYQPLDTSEKNYKDTLYKKSIKIAKLVDSSNLPSNKLNKYLIKFPNILTEEYDISLLNDINVNIATTQNKKVTFYEIIMTIIQFNKFTPRNQEVIFTIWNNLNETNKDIILYYVNLVSEREFEITPIIDAFFDTIKKKKIDINMRKDLLFSEINEYIDTTDSLVAWNIYFIFVKMAIEDGLNINHKNSNNDTFLSHKFMVCTKNNIFQLKMLIENLSYFIDAGIDTKNVNKNNLTLLDAIVNSLKTFPELISKLTQNHMVYFEVNQLEILLDYIQPTQVIQLINISNALKKKVDVKKYYNKIIKFAFENFNNKLIRYLHDGREDAEIDILLLDKFINKTNDKSVVNLMFENYNVKFKNSLMECILRKYKDQFTFSEIIGLVKPFKIENGASVYDTQLLDLIIEIYKDELTLDEIKKGINMHEYMIRQFFEKKDFAIKNFRDSDENIITFLKDNNTNFHKVYRCYLFENNIVNTADKLLFCYKNLKEKFDEILKQTLENCTKEEGVEMLTFANEDGNTIIHLLSKERNKKLLKYIMNGWDIVPTKNKNGLLPGDIYKMNKLSVKLGVS